MEIKVLDISGKTEIKCPNCGLVQKFPERIVDMESLKHMEDNRKFLEWQKENKIKGHLLGNVRLMICLKCQQIMICKDRFTIEKKAGS